MYQIQFDHPVPVHFIGIGGISMSGLAAILLKAGFPVSGSDAKESALTRWLSNLGARILYGQKASNIDSNTQVVVYTAAIHPDNPEYAQAVSMQLPMLSRAQLLGQLMRNYEMPIAVAGTHGKTTTTSMLSHILLAEDRDPTISVGGILPSIGGNVRLGNSGTFLTEACEYTNSFLEFFPKLSIILNIDADHLDFFKDLEDIRHSFRLFAERLPENGTLILDAGIPQLEAFTKGLACRVWTYGLSKGDFHADAISYDAHGCGSFDLIGPVGKIGRFSLQVPGVHNISNAVAALAAACVLSVSKKAMEEGLHSFTGTDRRFQIKGSLSGVTIVDDYAHHPTEIRATLQASINYPHRETWCVFQPHTYSRTKSLLAEFTEALSTADHVILADIYAARETDTLGVSSAMLCDLLRQKGCDAWYFPTFDDIETFLLANCVSGDLILTMGAGNVYQVGEALLGKCED